MDINYYVKEEQKNSQTEPSYNKWKSNSIDKINFKNKIEYSKKLQQKHIINIQKLFSKGKIGQNKIPQLPLFNMNISKNNSIRLKDSTNPYVYTLKKEDIIQKEKLISQIFIIEDEINDRDEEINEYKEFYKHLKENNLTFKTIIERLLNIEEDETKINNESIKEEKKKKEPKKINRLKLQIKSYDKNIVKKEKVLDKTKNQKKINNFISINKLLNEKNKELENLVTGSQKLQYSQHEIDKKVDFYFAAIKSYRENYTKLTDKLKFNEKELKFNMSIIEHKEREIVDCYIKVEKLEEDLKLLEKNNVKTKEKKEKIKEEYENDKEIQKEKKMVDKDLENLSNKSFTIKKIIEKNNRNIERIKHENEELENEISVLKAERDKLNEKSKETQKGKQNLKNYLKEIRQVKEEIKKNKIKYENKIKKEKEEEIRIKKEIEEFEKAKSSLINKINELTDELKERTMENNIKEEELNKANEEYNNVMKENKSNN